MLSPPWWTWLFYGTIAWAAIYLIVFHVTDSMPLSQEEYHRELALVEEVLRTGPVELRGTRGCERPHDASVQVTHVHGRAVVRGVHGPGRIVAAVRDAETRQRAFELQKVVAQRIECRLGVALEVT